MAQLAAAVSDLDEIERQKFRPALQGLARRVRQGMGLTSDNAAAVTLKTFPVLDWNDPTP